MTIYQDREIAEGILATSLKGCKHNVSNDNLSGQINCIRSFSDLPERLRTGGEQ